MGYLTQGVEMGRPGLLRSAPWRAPSGVRASAGGRCVPVLEGVATVRGLSFRPQSSHGKKGASGI